VRVFGWFEKDDDNVGLIMEYLSGGNLLQLIENKDINLKPLLCLRMCIDVAEGLKYLHDLPPSGLVHGNIKTENVLLTDSLRCKITGLGLASLHVNRLDTNTVPECIYEEDEDSMVFVAPEFLHDRSIAADFSQDVYSFSLIVYQLLSRKKPFKAIQDSRNYKNVILKGERPNLFNILTATNEYRQKRGFDGEVSILENLADVMQRCWSPTPSDRPLMSRVKTELVDLRNKFETSDLLRDAANVTKILNPKPIIRDRRHLVSIHSYLRSSEYILIIKEHKI